MELFSDIDPRVLTAAVRVLPENPAYTLNRVLPDREIDDIEFAIEDVLETNRAAHFRAYDAPVEIGPGPQLVRSTGEIPAIGEGYLVGEYARLLQERLRGARINPELERLALNYAARGIRAIRARMEVARGSLISSGRFTLTGEGGLRVDFDMGVPTGNFVDPAIPWATVATANIIQNLTDWVDIAEQQTGIRPDTILAGRSAISWVLQNQAMRELYGNQIGTPQQITIGQVNTILDGLDLPTFAVDPAAGKAIRPSKVSVDGTTVDTFPANAVALFPSGQLGETLWGPTFEALELAQTGQIEAQDAPGVIALVMREGNPGKLFTVANATGLPVLHKPEALVIATSVAA